MKAARSIVLPIVATVVSLSWVFALFVFTLSTSELHQLEHVAQGFEPNLPGATRLYQRIYGYVFVIPCAISAAGFTFLRSDEAEVTRLTWFICLSLLAVLLWGIFSFTAVHVGFMLKYYI